MLVECIFFSEAASQLLQQHLQCYQKGSCFYRVIQKPSDLLANRELFLRFSYGSENMFSRLYCHGW